MATTEVVRSTHVQGIATIEVLPHVSWWKLINTTMPTPCGIAMFDTQHGQDVRTSWPVGGCDKLF